MQTASALSRHNANTMTKHDRDPDIAQREHDHQHREAHDNRDPLEHAIAATFRRFGFFGGFGWFALGTERSEAY